MNAIIGSMRLGAWGANLRAHEVARFLRQCVEIGCSTLDSADIYGDGTTNALIGAAFRLEPELRHTMRILFKSGIVLAGPTVYHYNSSPIALRAALNQALANLGVETIDTLMLHRFDHLAHVDELQSFMRTCIEQGVVRRFGVSNASADQLRVCSAVAAIDCHQFQLSLAHWEGLATHDQTRGFGCRSMAWSPLGGGQLSGDQAPGPLTTCLRNTANELALSCEQVALRWVGSLPQMQVVLGTHRIERVIAAKRALAEPLSHPHWYALLEAARGSRLP